VASTYLVSVEGVFEKLAVTASRATAGAAVAAWARVENAACARRLFAIADELERQYAADGSTEREQWCLDNWDAVAAEVAAAQNVSLGVASHQVLIADALRERLPRVAEVFATGAISYRMVAAVVTRTRLIIDAEAMANVDAELAAHISAWGPLSVTKTEAAIDHWVDLYDPAALRRTELSARGRHVDITDADTGTGLANLEGALFGCDAAALDKRLDAMAAAVCKHDPRTIDQRRSDALAALAHGGDRLTCGCGAADCEAAGTPPSAVVIHVVAEHDAVADDTGVRLDGPPPPGPTTDELTQVTLTEALRPRADEVAPGPAAASPAKLMSGGMMPAPLLAAKLADTAKIVPIVHPGDAPPEPRYIPSAVLAWFVRCRDMACRFPGCDQPADVCDIDHTIPYPGGPTQASNLKCLCRKHHLLKTFGGWRDQQLPDGTVVWTSPRGQSYTTHPASRLLFPSLCRPTASVAKTKLPTDDTVDTAARSLKMPRRKRTRAQNCAQAIQAERRLNDDRVAERNKPPPF
jgi:hypothetical protein